MPQVVHHLPPLVLCLLLLLFLHVDVIAQVGVALRKLLPRAGHVKGGCTQIAGGCQTLLHLSRLLSSIGGLGGRHFGAEEFADREHAVCREEAGRTLLVRFRALRGQSGMLASRGCRHLPQLALHAVRVAEQLRVQRRDRHRRGGGHQRGLALSAGCGGFGRTPRGLHHVANSVGLVGIVLGASIRRDRRHKREGDKEAHHS
mmetsp:Transcript_69999/g.177684  ORF Transcript_69999/g.177684 Transcript_69999/m.177684 type:complete len:202 (+) Transcript_69999:111-716(+)